MSTKKRFTISPDLATGIRNTIQSASSNVGQLHYDMMTIDLIEPDPANPRKLSISIEEVLHGVETHDALYQKKSKELESIKELAESIKRIGVRNAVEVYKTGTKYRIICGERRYLAVRLLGQKSIPVRINQKPDEFNIRYMQWVENINRQDLSLWEKFNNLVSIASAYQKANQIELDEQSLQKLLGISNIQAYRYFYLLKADEKILELIQLGKLNNLKLIQELGAMKDKTARSQIIAGILSSKDEVTSLNNYKEIFKNRSLKLKQKKGPAISLGKLTNVVVAKQVFEILLAGCRLNQYDQRLKMIDWNVPKSVTKAFKELFKRIEKEIGTEEIA